MKISKWASAFLKLGFPLSFSYIFLRIGVIFDIFSMFFEIFSVIFLIFRKIKYFCNLNI